MGLVVSLVVMLLIVIGIFFIMPYWIMHVAAGLFGVDWSTKYWLIIQLQLILGWIAGNSSIKFKKN